MRDIGAEIGHRLDLEGEKAPVAIERQGAFGDMIAALRIALERLIAPAHPFDRPAEAARRPQHQGMFRIDEIFHAEAAAEVARDDADLAWLQAHALRRQIAHGEMIVAIGMQPIAPARRVIFPQRAARLDRRRRHPVVAKLDLDHMLGAGEGLLHRRLVAGEPVETDIAGRFGP